MKRLTFLLAGLAPLLPCTLSAAEITIKGSDTMVVMAQRWAEEFMKENPGTSLQVTGGGSGTGIAALLNNTTDIAISSRPIKPKEAADFVVAVGGKPIETKTALDGLAVYVHDSNPIPHLSLAQLSGIFRGEIKNFKEVGGADRAINLYSRENNSGTYAYFKEHVLKEKDFASNAQNMPGTAALINAIGKDPAAIGYGGIGYAHGTRTVPILSDAGKPVQPVMENVVSGEYPLSRGLLIYTSPANKKPEVKKFLEWICGPKGQGLVAECGYYPLPGVQVAKMENPQAPTTTVRSSAGSPNAGAEDLFKIAYREALVAEREMKVAEREMKIADRELRLSEREMAIGGVAEAQSTNKRR